MYIIYRLESLLFVSRRVLSWCKRRLAHPFTISRRCRKVTRSASKAWPTVASLCLVSFHLLQTA